VAETRKRYDEVRTEAVRLEGELDKQRRQCEALREEETHLQQHISGTKKVGM
jgi:DNA repair exonuclease SbcCD ATPase subunit